MSPVRETPETTTDHEPGSRPWRLGLLSLLALLLVGGSVVLFGGNDDETDPATTVAAADITIPPLPTTNPRAGAAPDFSLELFDGSQFSLSTHLADDGRPVILNLWASWCPPCRDEMPDLEAASIAHPDVLILGVAVDDDPIAAEDFVDEISITYPAGFDAADRVSRNYPSSGLPATFVISSDGILVRSAFGRLTVEDIESLVADALAG